MRDDYHAAHIPGARFLAMDKFADHITPGTELLPPDQLKKNLEDIGISDDSRVVYYAPDWDPMATRLFFTLDYLGHGDQQPCSMAAWTSGCARSGRLRPTIRTSPAER